MKRDDKMVYRLPPCPLYDVERYESWLGDMAAAGLFCRRRTCWHGSGAARPPRCATA